MEWLVEVWEAARVLSIWLSASLLVFTAACMVLWVVSGVLQGIKLIREQDRSKRKMGLK